VAETEHLPSVPAWTCRTCLREWPCYPARDRLLTEYVNSPTSLALYLAACFVKACDDLERAPSAALYRRFLGWYRLRR
jgi:hypothetical protein